MDRVIIPLSTRRQYAIIKKGCMRVHYVLISLFSSCEVYRDLNVRLYNTQKEIHLLNYQ